MTLNLALRKKTNIPERSNIRIYIYMDSIAKIHQAANEATLRQLTEEADGRFGTMQEAVEALGIPRLKLIRPTPIFKGYLTLGNPDEYDSAICIDIERYPKVMIRRPLTASNFVQRSRVTQDGESGQSSTTMIEDNVLSSESLPADANPFTTVRNERMYQITDEGAAGGKRDVERDQLAKGYEYGRTAVHISESDYNVTKLETKEGLEILGFVPMPEVSLVRPCPIVTLTLIMIQFERFMTISSSSMTVGARSNPKAVLALSSFIHALYEQESYAIARFVQKRDKEPSIVLLAPLIDLEYECLIDVQLPFAEDVRSYRFRPLDRVITVSGKEIRVHRNLPSEKLQAAMDDYVDSMDISSFGRDDNG